MMSNTWWRGSRWVLQGVSVTVALAAVLLVGCGGGGGDGAGDSRFTLSGVVTVPEGTGRQAVSGYALANATVRAYIWPNLTEHIAQSSTDSNGRYTIALPENAVGKDILVVATKQVGDRTVRVQTLAADVPATGRENVHLDAFTTFAVEEIARVRVPEGLDNLSAGGFADVVRRFRERLGSWTGDLAAVLPPQIGGELQDDSVRSLIRQVVQELKNALKGSTGDVAIARGMMQTVRDLMGTVVSHGGDENTAIDTALNMTREALDAQLATAEEFSERFDVMMNMLERLEGRPSGEYRLIRNEWGDTEIQRMGDIAGGKTWKVTSQVAGPSSGLVLTVTTERPIEEFRFDPAAGRYTLSATKQGVNYSATLTPAINQSSRVIELQASISLQDSVLTQPLTFNGTLVAVFAELPSQDAPPRITSATFNGQLNSQFGSAQVTNLKVEFDPDSSADDSLKRITLQSLQAQITAKPFSLSLQGVDLPFMKLSGGGTTPSRVIVNRLQMMGRDASNGQLSLTLSEVSGTIEQYRDPVNGMGSGVLKSLQGKVNFASSRMALSGEVSGTWSNAVPFALVPDATKRLSTFPAGSIRITGNMTPAIGKPAGVDITVTSAPQGSPAPKVTANANLSYGNESMQLSVEMLLREHPYEGVQPHSSTISMVHSPSGMRMHLAGEAERPLSGTIKKSDGTKVADIGEAQEIGLPDLGKVMVIKYTDGTFETMGSLLP
ncbi:MAG: hypothetical protein RMK92_03020 [Armatimonadota bacterium]|nr:hypothetical protein [Armatimonadota bacterium]